MQPLGIAIQHQRGSGVLSEGETLSIPAERLSVKEGHAYKGYTLVCIDGFSAGWGKWQDGLLKNEYPAGWRWT